MSDLRRLVIVAIALPMSAIAGAQVPQGSPAPSQTRAQAAAALDAALPKLEAVCYGRIYDAAHLKNRPKQEVTSLLLKRDFAAVRLERRMESEREAKDGRNAYVGVSVTYRDSKARRFEESANCAVRDGGDIYCSASSCDGGGFRLRIENAQTIVIGDKQAGARFTLSGGCRGGPDRNLNRGEDDGIFRLTKLPMTQCR